MSNKLSIFRINSAVYAASLLILSSAANTLSPAATDRLNVCGRSDTAPISIKGAIEAPAAVGFSWEVPRPAPISENVCLLEWGKENNPYLLRHRAARAGQGWIAHGRIEEDTVGRGQGRVWEDGGRDTAP